MMLNKGMQPSGAEKIMKRAWTDHPWFPFLVIIAASALAHLWCLNAVFYLDDMHIIKNNDFLRDGRMSELRGMRMWTRFFQLMQYRLFGDSSVGFHAVNWLLHTSVACVLFGFGRDFLRDRAPVGVAWFAALLFAVHPLASEIPNYARCQDLAWVTLFSLLATWALLSFLQRGGRLKLVWVVLAVVAASISKNPGMFHVSMMLGAVGLGFMTPAHWKSSPRWIWWVAGIMLLGIAALWFAGVIPNMLRHTKMWAEPRFIGHGYTLARVFWEFAWRAVIPVGLSSDHQIAETLVPPGTGLWTIPDKVAMFAAASMLALTVLSLFLAWRKPTRLFGICLFLFVGTMLFRVMYLINEFMPEYRIYPGMPWFCMGAGIFLHALWKRLPGEGSPRLFAVLILLPCIWLSAQRSFLWHDLDRLMADVLKQYPTQSRAIWMLQERDATAGEWQKVIDRHRNEWPAVFRRNLEENKRLAPARELPTGHLAMADVACGGRYAQALAHTVSPAAGLAELRRLEAYMQRLRIDPVAHRIHWAYYYKFKALVLEEAGDYEAALQLIVDKKVAEPQKADRIRLEKKLAESR